MRPALHRLLLDRAEQFGDRLAVADTKRSLTYGELAAQIVAGAKTLQRRGLVPGGRVILSIPNSVDFVVAHFAVLAAGGISVPCEARAPTQVLTSIAVRTEASFALLSPDVASAWLAAPDTPLLAVLCCGLGTTPQGCDDFAALIQDCLGESAALSERGAGDVSTVLFTTGTTGRPKGVVLAHEQTLFTINNLIHLFDYRPEDREVITIPIAHSFGLGHVYCNLFSGGAVYLEPGLINFKRVFNALTSFGATGFPGTPLGFGMMMDRAASLLKEVARSLRFIVIDSAPMPPARTKQLQALLPDTEIFVYYGLTEASRSTIISLSAEGPDYYASVGKPPPGVEVELAANSGEVLIRGPHLACGYWQDEELTSEVFSGGWLHTGDIGRFDGRGMLFLTGRLKDQINVGGQKVDPSEVEALIRKGPNVADVGICGLENVDGVDGETVACGIVPAVPGVLNEQDLAAFCARQTEAYKIPSKWFLVECIPRTETGKLIRAELRAMLNAKLLEKKI